eukprot:TRINITY_DN7797_c1_g1_i1.p1 TRINITY_DN7797_c1_g1~~TRINITY_DN7797_c1_g1_i1.p1  ORF type:complete len:822 (+),score=240.02 TRINITY_DN7797_c1_g1_i1:268-2466(+)
MFDCLLSKPHRQSAETLYRLMVRDHPDPDGYVSGLIVMALSACGLTGPAFELITTVAEREGDTPQQSLYGALLNGCGKFGDAGTADFVIKQMRDKGIVLDLRSYTAYMNAFAKEHTPEKAERVWGEMEQAGLKPNAIVLNCYVESLIGSISMEEMDKRVSAMVKKHNIACDHITYTTLMRHAASVADVGRILELFEEYSASDGGGPLGYAQAMWLMRACAKRGDAQTAIEFLQEHTSKMQHARDVVSSYYGLIDSCSREGNFSAAMEAARALGEFLNLEPEEGEGGEEEERQEVQVARRFKAVDLNAIISLLRATGGKMEEVKEVIAFMRENRHFHTRYSLNWLLVACVNGGEYSDARQVYAHFKQFKLRRDATTYAEVMHACTHLQDIVMGEKLYRDASLELPPPEMPPVTFEYAALLCAGGRGEDALPVLNGLAGGSGELPPPVLGALFSHCVQGGDGPMAVRLLRREVNSGRAVCPQDVCAFLHALLAVEESSRAWVAVEKLVRLMREDKEILLAAHDDDFTVGALLSRADRVAQEVSADLAPVAWKALSVVGAAEDHIPMRSKAAAVAAAAAAAKEESKDVSSVQEVSYGGIVSRSHAVMEEQGTATRSHWREFKDDASATRCVFEAVAATRAAATGTRALIESLHRTRIPLDRSTYLAAMIGCLRTANVDAAEYWHKCLEEQYGAGSTYIADCVLSAVRTSTGVAQSLPAAGEEEGMAGDASAQYQY